MNTLNTLNEKNIVLTVINKKINNDLLKNTTYIELLDLAIIFNYVTSIGTDEITSVILDKEILKDYNVSSLYKKSLENTKRLLGVSLKRLDDVIINFTKKRLEMPECIVRKFLNIDKDLNCYVLSNSINVNGASIILFKEVFKKICYNLNMKEVIILPLSKHELVLLENDKSTKREDLANIISEINNTSNQNEILSYNIYLYNYKDDTFNFY